MKISVRVLSVCAVFLALAAEARQFNNRQLERLLSQMRQVDFEGFGVYSSSCGESFAYPLGTVIVPRLENPLTLGGMIIESPRCLRAVPCEAPLCEPDTSNEFGWNILLQVNVGGTITFLDMPRMVVLDLQGNGRPFTLRVRDSRGETFDVRGEPELFSKMLLPLFSPQGIHSLEVLGIERQEDDGVLDLHIAAIYLP